MNFPGPSALQAPEPRLLPLGEAGIASFDTTWILATALVATRIGALVLFSPALGGAIVPATVRSMVVLALAATLVANAPVAPELRLGLGSDPARLAVALALEAALGATMALGVAMAFAAFSAGARLVDLQIGFGLGQVFDPSTRQATPVIAALASWLALATFFLVDAHHGLLRGLALSLEAVPPGAPWALTDWLPGVLHAAGQMASLGFVMFAPVIACLLVVEVALGVSSRFLPQMNVLVLGMPVKAFAGLAAVAALASLARWPLERMHQGGFATWSAMWR